MSETLSLTKPHNAMLLLADGTVFYGFGVGYAGKTIGEICFNTGMTGYQETISDPSYAGQIITFTFPHIGNTGANDDDIESFKPAARGIILREEITESSNFRAEETLNNWLVENHITGIADIDTRALTRHIRINGACNAIIYHAKEGEALPAPEDLQNELAEYPSLAGMDLAKYVTCSSLYHWKQKRWELGEVHGESDESSYHIVAIDFGAKLNILRSLAEYNC